MTIGTSERGDLVDDYQPPPFKYVCMFGITSPICLHCHLVVLQAAFTITSRPPIIYAHAHAHTHARTHPHAQTHTAHSSCNVRPNAPRHLLIMLGGLAGLEAAVDNDTSLDVSEPRELFDAYLNTCPNQGSRTIRTEVGGVALCMCVSAFEKGPTHIAPSVFRCAFAV